MPSITGRDLSRYTFTRSGRGYSRVEVDQFVAVVAAELDRLNALLAQRTGNEEGAVLLLRSAASTADETNALAKAEAEQIRTGAAAKAAEVTEASVKEAEAQTAEARRKALQIMESAKGEAARISDSARQQSEEAHQRVEWIRGLLLSQVNRLRGGAVLMQASAKRLESAVDDDAVNVIDTTQPLMGEFAGET